MTLEPHEEGHPQSHSHTENIYFHTYTHLDYTRTHTAERYLFLDVAVAADSPQVLEGPPQQDDEEPPEEGHHGGGEECPPHALPVVVAGHLGREGDDDVFHLGDQDRGVRLDVIITADDISAAAAAAAPHRAVAAMGDGAIRLG